MNIVTANGNRYESLTHGVRVAVEPLYMEERSNPDENQWVWAYSVEITNEGDQTIQLKTRHWEITDGVGKMEVVSGPGVIGEQPVLNPGDEFHYSSGCPLNTPSGFMVGHYEMKLEDGAMIQVAIPAFSLDLPHARIILN